MMCTVLTVTRAHSNAVLRAPPRAVDTGVWRERNLFRVRAAAGAVTGAW